MCLSIFLSNQSFSFQVENSGKKIVELGKFFDNLKIWADGWENYDGD